MPVGDRMRFWFRSANPRCSRGQPPHRKSLCLGGKINAHSQEINELVAASQGNVDRKVAKRLITRAASDMDQYVARMEVELPLFWQNLDEGMKALIRAAMLSV